ncbi:hypothetical protein MMC30_000736 [Trapelia coarctata]|nr:hypothetical protein [Trapelia coarctata]
MASPGGKWLVKPYNFMIGTGLCGRERYYPTFDYSMIPVHYIIYTQETMENPLEEITFCDPSYDRPQSVNQLTKKQFLQQQLLEKKEFSEMPSLEKLFLEELVLGEPLLESSSLGHYSHLKSWQFNPSVEDPLFEAQPSEEQSFEGPGDDLQSGIDCYSFDGSNAWGRGKRFVKNEWLTSVATATVPAVGAAPPVLPPSVEEAYKKKCIELKCRMNEVEEHNDQYRLRKARLDRGIRKMRLERAILLETLAKRMKKNGADGLGGMYDEESEGSSEGPPTPQEKPLRSKRGHRRPAQSPHSATTRGALPQQTLVHHSSSSYSTPIAPHPGPGPFSHTNGNPTSNPAPIHPLPAQNQNSYSTYQRSSLIGLPPQPQQPPSALDLFMDTISTEMANNPNLHPNVAPEAFAAYCQNMYRNLAPRDREHYERAFEAKMTRYEQEMQVWEENRQRLALRGGEAEGNEEANGEEGEEEKMEGVEGGFTAVNG